MVKQGDNRKGKVERSTLGSIIVGDLINNDEIPDKFTCDVIAAKKDP